MIACLDGDLGRVRALLGRGVDVNEGTPESEDEHSLLGHDFTIPSGGRTPLMMAAYRGNVTILRALLDAGARVDAVSDTGDTALCEAVSSKQRKALALLVSRGADVNQPAMFTPLYHAASDGNVPLARWLLEQGAQVDAPIWTGTTALMAAAAAGSGSLVALLLAHGANPKRKDRNQQTALHVAVTRHKHPDEPDDPSAIAHALLRAGAPVDAKDHEGATPLLIAAKRYDEPVEVVDVLLGAGARVDAKDPAGATALAHACSMNQLEVAMRLLDAGARLHTKDKAGMTPFLNAARNGYLDLGYSLLARGVRPADRSRALQLARSSRRDDFVRLLNGEQLPVVKIPRTLRTLIERADALYVKQRYAAALELYESIPPAFRGRIFATISNAGYCLQQLGRNAEAAPLFERALELEPSRATHLLRAICYACYERGQWEPMLQTALRGTTLSPNDDYLWQQLALAHHKLGNHRDAIKAGERAIRVNPKNGYAQMNLANDYAKLGDPRYVETLAASLELAPQLKTALSRKAIAALRADRFAALVRRLRLK